jgi:hypothetical protein
MGDSFIAVSIIGESGFVEYDIMGDSFMAVSIIGDSGFVKYDIMGDSFISVFIIGDSGFAEKALSKIPDLHFCLFIPNSVIAESVTLISAAYFAGGGRDEEGGCV